MLLIGRALQECARLEAMDSFSRWNVGKPRRLATTTSTIHTYTPFVAYPVLPCLALFCPCPSCSSPQIFILITDCFAVLCHPVVVDRCFPRNANLSGIPTLSVFYLLLTVCWVGFFLSYLDNFALIASLFPYMYRI